MMMIQIDGDDDDRDDGIYPPTDTPSLPIDLLTFQLQQSVSEVYQVVLVVTVGEEAVRDVVTAITHQVTAADVEPTL